jgi:hypothetical protein
MATKEITLLKQQIEKLDIKDFDLSAWKKFTIVFLARIFGDDSPKISQIEKIESDYSSWSLRDTSGSSSIIEASKKLAREILEAAIAEIEIFGIPGKTDDTVSIEIINIINETLQDELKGSQYKELTKIIKSSLSAKEKQSKIAEKIKIFGYETSIGILSGILANSKIAKMI